MVAPDSPSHPLGVALAGLRGLASLRERIEWASSLGFRGVQLNAAEAGVRPRDLSRSARRDLASLLRRSELLPCGVDLRIPPAHYLDPARADHAMAAVCDSINFAAEMAALTDGDATLSLTLPENPEQRATVVETFGERCLRAGARIADYAWPPAPNADPASPIGVGVNPASILQAGAGLPENEVLRLGARVFAVRLADIAPRGTGGRGHGGAAVAPGDGQLDLLAFLVALSTMPTAGALPLVLDLEGVPDQTDAARQTIERCHGGAR